jgi:beta-glucosidase
MLHSSADFGRQAPAMHHMLVAHAQAVAVFRAGRTPGMIGIALPLYPALPLKPNDADDVAAARLLDGLINRWPLDATLRGSYPDDVIGRLQQHNGAFKVQAADLEVLKANPVDFVGVNFYSPAIVTADAGFPLGLRWGNSETNPDPVPAFNGPVRPEELYRLLIRVRADYGNVPILISENGAGFGDRDETVIDGIGDDPLRTDFVTRHIQATLRARSEGVDVRGYMYWSLCDNFEWIQGYERRFGMVHVDFATQERTPKRSLRTYRDMIARNRGG